jgi:hypothetical protein
VLDPEKADRIAGLYSRMAVLLREWKKAHDAREYANETVLQARIADLDKEIEELRR